jgi:hypothetical protein
VLGSGRCCDRTLTNDTDRDALAQPNHAGERRYFLIRRGSFRTRLDAGRPFAFAPRKRSSLCARSAHH